MALNKQLVDRLTSAGFNRVFYTDHSCDKDLNYYKKIVHCHSLRVLKRSSAFDEIFSHDDEVEVEVVGDYDEIQLVVKSCDYAVSHISIGSEDGESLLTDCGVSFPAKDPLVVGGG